MTHDPTTLHATRGRAASRAPGLGRRRFFAAVLVLLTASLLSDAPPAHPQSPAPPPLPDAIPTAWHEAAGLTPLLTAPPPPNPATICIIDTGVTPTPDLDITARWAYDGGTLDDVHATPENPGHGTLVAHFAAGAVNGWGGAGAFPHARISSVRVFPREGGASWREYIAAISRCSKLDPNTKVIVISIGGQEIERGEADELEAHIRRARDRYGVNVVAAAGNGGGRPDFPGRFDAAFTVAAATAGGRLCDFSARGPEVDIAAPGCGVVHAGVDGSWWSLDGSSFAAPVVAGALAALRSYDAGLGAAEAESILVVAATGEAPGMVDAENAFERAGLGAVVERVAGTSASQTPASIPVAALPAGPPLRVDGARARAVTRLPRPAVRAVRAGGQVVFVVRNRPRGTVVQLQLGERRVLRRVSRLRLRTATRRGRCRFVTALQRSPWTTVRW